MASGNCISGLLNFKVFWGSMPPDPPRDWRHRRASGLPPPPPPPAHKFLATAMIAIPVPQQLAGRWQLDARDFELCLWSTVNTYTTCQQPRSQGLFGFGRKGPENEVPCQVKGWRNECLLNKKGLYIAPSGNVLIYDFIWPKYIPFDERTWNFYLMSS